MRENRRENLRAMRGSLAACACSLVATGSAVAGSPFAAEVISYEQGTGTIPSYLDPSAALGAPTRMTGEDFGFPSVVSPFSPPFDSADIVSVGQGGSLTLRMGSPITDNLSNPFGIDFIVFGNAGFLDTSYPNGEVGDAPTLLGAGAAVRVQVSADGAEWVDVATRKLDLFPTLGYRDAGPFDTIPGSDPTSFLTPMDPGLGLADIAGLNYAELVGVYGRSGGGVGFDLAPAGLVEASFVRFLHAGGAGETFQIDAVSVVPAPMTGLVLLGLFGTPRLRRAGA